MKVLITSPCSASVIIQYGIKSWPIWECEPSKFQWNYDDKEICLIIEGQAKISTQNGNIYVIKAGDLVEFWFWTLLRMGSNQKYKKTL